MSDRPSEGAQRDAAPMLSTAQALAALLAAASPPITRRGGVETVALAAGNHRVLVEDIVSPIDVPPMDVSAMDGYAVRSADVAALATVATAGGRAAESLSLPVSQRIPAGAAPTPLAAGTVARIFTGAPVPAGADTVVIQEETRAAGDRVVLMAAPAAGQWINRRGGDIAAGSVILRAGTRMTPQALGLAASVGIAALRVARRLRVALVFTGDELKRPGEPLTPGAIYNSNRYTLGGLLDNLGCEISDFGIVADRLDATRSALRAAAADHDLVLTCGGVSVGEEDHVKAAVEAEGRLALWRIAMKPGKPLAFGALRGHRNADASAADNVDQDANAGAGAGAGAGAETHFIGLPGNPVSAFVTFALFVRPFLLALQGVPHAPPQAVTARADFSVRGDRRNEFLRVRLNDRGGLDLYANQSSGVLTSTVWADGLVDNPPGQAIAPGDMVRFLPFAALLQ